MKQHIRLLISTGLSDFPVARSRDDFRTSLFRKKFFVVNRTDTKRTPKNKKCPKRDVLGINKLLSRSCPNHSVHGFDLLCHSLSPKLLKKEDFPLKQFAISASPLFAINQ